MPKGHRKLPKFSPQESQRFWTHVEVGLPDECWPFSNGSRYDYGHFSLRRERRTLIASRVAYFLHYGVDPAGLQVCHICDVCNCCNPAHLFLGTNTDNVRDMIAKGRNPKGATHWTRRMPSRIARGERHVSHTHPEKIRRGEAHSNSKLTENDVQEIHRLIAEGLGDIAIGRIFGITSCPVYKIRKGKAWKHVKPLGEPNPR